MIPKRWQRSRKAGAKQSDSCRYVGRGTKYGNKHKVITGGFLMVTFAHEHAVNLYRLQMEENLKNDPAFYDDLLNYEYISCFCPLDMPCHCDAIIEHLKKRVNA
jgi:hypothetical protein